MTLEGPKHPGATTSPTRGTFTRLRAGLAHMLIDTEQGVDENWFLVLCVGMLAAFALLGSLRLLRMAQVWIGVTAAVTLSVMGIVLLVWVYWQMRVDAHDRTPWFS